MQIVLDLTAQVPKPAVRQKLVSKRHKGHTGGGVSEEAAPSTPAIHFCPVPRVCAATWQYGVGNEPA